MEKSAVIFIENIDWFFFEVKNSISFSCPSSRTVTGLATKSVTEYQTNWPPFVQ